MGNVSRPLLGLLIATVVFFALWLIALKPGNSSNSTSGSQGLGAYQSAVNAARGAVTTSNAANAAAAGETTTAGGATSGASAQTATTKSTAVGSHTTSKRSTLASAGHGRHHAPARSTAHHAARTSAPATPAARLAVVKRALSQKKVLALLFYNPAAPDDNAVRQEIASISTHRGAVVKLEIPLTELPSYTVVISQVPVNFSPTLVIIDREQQAQEITGFADSYEIEQRLEQALSTGTTAG